ncbi:MAG: hypothetical protein R3B70_40820 [Polyangiaceae bacterium]
MTLTRTGYRPYSVEIDFRRDERRPLDVQMEQTTQRYAALGFLGAAGAGLIAGGIFTGIAFAQQGRAQSIETQMGTRNLTEQERADHDSAVTSRDEMRIGAIGAFAGTTLLALIGTGLFIFDRSTPGLPTKLRDDTPAPPQAKRAPKVGFTAIPSFGPTGGGMTVELRF